MKENNPPDFFGQNESSPASMGLLWFVQGTEKERGQHSLAKSPPLSYIISGQALYNRKSPNRVRSGRKQHPVIESVIQIA